MTHSAIVHTQLAHSAEAGTDLGSRIRAAFRGERPDAVILFASPRYEHAKLLRALDAACAPRALVGASSAGEFTSGMQAEGTACAVALRAPEMRFTATVGRRLGEAREQAAAALVDGFQGRNHPSFVYRSALVLADALAGHMEEFVGELTVLTGGTYRLFGGGAGGDEQFERRSVFRGTEVLPDAAVALEILSNKPIGVGVGHGWRTCSGPMRVTEARERHLGSLNAMPAAEAFEEHAERTGQPFERQQPLPFFLHNVLGVTTDSGHKLRVPLAVQEDGSVLCATEVPQGSTVHVMQVSAASAAEAAARSTEEALRQLGDHKPAAALFFDCVATRLRMGREFGFELEAVQRVLGDVRFAGCNTIGQIARAEGQFSGFHNCTAVVCVFPE